MSFLLLFILFVWIQNGYDAIYFTGPNAVSYIKAIEYCNNAGGVLASITNANENAVAVNVCIAGNPPGNGCWFGLNDADVQDSYKYVDGTSVNGSFGFNINGQPTTGVFPWHNNEPNKDSERCISLWKPQSYKWNDYGCNNDLLPLCRAIAPNQGIRI